jgi:hypothetical protein
MESKKCQIWRYCFVSPSVYLPGRIPPVQAQPPYRFRVKVRQIQTCIRSLKRVFAWTITRLRSEADLPSTGFGSCSISPSTWKSVIRFSLHEILCQGRSGWKMLARIQQWETENPPNLWLFLVFWGIPLLNTATLLRYLECTPWVRQNVRRSALPPEYEMKLQTRIPVPI